MRGIVLAGATVLLCAVAGWSQSYYEASGRTAVFTLKAGATSGPASIRSGHIAYTGFKGVTFSAAKGSIVVVLPAQHQGFADIALYDIAGRQAYRQSGYRGTALHLETRLFAPGIYTAVVLVDGNRYSHRFAVAGRGI